MPSVSANPSANPYVLPTAVFVERKVGMWERNMGTDPKKHLVERLGKLLHGVEVHHLHNGIVYNGQIQRVDPSQIVSGKADGTLVPIAARINATKENPRFTRAANRDYTRLVAVVRVDSTDHVVAGSEDGAEYNPVLAQWIKHCPCVGHDVCFPLTGDGNGRRVRLPQNLASDPMLAACDFTVEHMYKEALRSAKAQLATFQEIGSGAGGKH